MSVLACWYYVCEPDEYLVKTGMFISGMVIAKKTMKWPFQKCRYISLHPNDYRFDLDTMSNEKVPFKLPMVFTIGPLDPVTDADGFMCYARKISGLNQREITELITGVVHGETRIMAAKLTVQEMFSDRQKFKNTIHENVNKILAEFGLYVANCNIAEMKDLDNENKYFFNLKQKALESASNQAKIDIAEEQKKGNVGQKKLSGEAEIEMKAIESNVNKEKNLREQEISGSNAALEVARLGYRQTQETKRIETENVPKLREQELKTELQKVSGLAKLEELRATELAKTIVDAEKVHREAEGQAKAMERTAQANLFRTTQEFEAHAASIERIAQANLIRSQLEAEGIRVKFDAESEGLKKMLTAGDADIVKYYIAVDRGLFTDMAQKTADAIQGLKPQIHVWNQSGDSANTFAPMRDIMNTLPPMLDAISSQTHTKMPNWLPHNEQ